MPGIANDLKHAVRTLQQSRSFSLTVISVLGCGTAACVIVFSAINATVLRPLPFADPDGLAFIWSSDARRAQTRMLTSYPDYLDWRDRTRAFVGLAAVRFARQSLAQTSAPLRVATIATTPNLLTLLGVTPAFGRSLTLDDAASGAPPVALLSHGIWVRVLGGDPSVLGSTVRLNAVTHTVIGILPDGLDRSGPLQADVWTALRPEATTSNDRSDRSYFVVGRLRPGVDTRQASTELTMVARTLEAEHAETNAGWSVQVLSPEDLTAGSRLILAILSVVVALILLIACTNVAGLQIARAAARRQETAVRLALGASRFRLMQQWLIENLLLSLLGAGLGLVLANAGLRLVSTIVGDVNPFLAEMAIDRSALAVAGALALATPLIFGVAPALAALRSSSADHLKPSGARGTVGSRARARRLLVVSQFAMTTALLVVTGLSVRSVLALRAIPLGFEPDHTLAMRIELSGPRYDSVESLRRFNEASVTALKELPGVTSVAVSTRLPIVDRETTRRFTIEGRPPVGPDEGEWAGWVATSPEFLEVTRVPLLEGRPLQETDGATAPPVAVINRALASRFWPESSPVGARLRFGSGIARSASVEIVGVVGDVRNSDADQTPVPQIYVPIAQDPQRAVAFLVRTTMEPSLLSDSVRRRIGTLDADQALFDIRTMRRLVFDDLAGTLVAGGLFGSFGIIALALALTGLYGMLAWSVGQRTSEIGLRMALGAQPATILQQFLREGGALVGVGIAVGLVAGAGLGQAISSTLYGVSALDPAVVLGLPAILAFAASVAIYAPARRAMRLDPLAALRYE
jgi:putative ABC transport system permease protein